MLDLRPHQRTFVALDTHDPSSAREMIVALRGVVGGFKIGLELFCNTGPALIEELHRDGAKVFCDLKFHDIPNTVAGAAAALGRLGVDLFTVHALGGAEMIRRGAEAARDAAQRSGHSVPVVLGVTILTSHDALDLRRIGLEGSVRDSVQRLARVALGAGAAGLVCSAAEVESMRQAHPEATLVVPGIRPRDLRVQGDDQARTASPAQAVRSGADYLVVGRPITRCDDPRSAAEAIAREIERLDE